jgi:enoyl-CoA hydratase/carnithine racemase
LDNALIRLMLNELAAADRDANVHCIVLTANGTSFCAGADLDELRTANDPAAAATERSDLLTELNIVVTRMQTPVIAAVNGPAIGGGAGLALGCDMVLATPKAKFGYPEVKHGITAATLLPNLLRQVGPKIAFELIATAESMSADRAYALGMINRIVAEEKLLTEALALATQIASFGTACMAASKRMFYQLGEMAQAEGLALARDVNPNLRKSLPH